VVSNGVFLMSTADGRSERVLVRAALERVEEAGRGLDVLIGGLGVGFSLREALADERVRHVRVVEIEAAVVAWNRTLLAPVHGHALEDPRVEVVQDDIAHHLSTTPARFDAVCLDVDNGPDWLVAQTNAGLYAPTGLDAAARVLRPGGALAWWGAAPSEAFVERLRTRFGAVETHTIPVSRGAPDVVWIVRPDSASG
jgi:spermidine synthase